MLDKLILLDILHVKRESWRRCITCKIEMTNQMITFILFGCLFKIKERAYVSYGLFWQEAMIAYFLSFI